MSEGEEDEEMRNIEDIEGDLMASMQGVTEDGVLPSIMMDQMELLELEMRARAIKAMLSSHDSGAHDDDDAGGAGVDDDDEDDAAAADESFNVDVEDEGSAGDNVNADAVGS